MISYLLMIDSEEDRSKFEKIYLQYRRLMYSEANKILHNVQDSEDAVHQAFLKIAENIEGIDDSVEANVKGLVVTIVRHSAIDMYRKKQNHPTVDLDACIGIAVEYDGSDALTSCMARLPAGYRDVLLLKNYYGYSSRETGKILGMSEANVIKTHQRARTKLEAMCIEEGIL